MNYLYHSLLTKRIITYVSLIILLNIIITNYSSLDNYDEFY